MEVAEYMPAMSVTRNTLLGGCGTGKPVPELEIRSLLSGLCFQELTAGCWQRFIIGGLVRFSTGQAIIKRRWGNRMGPDGCYKLPL